MATFITIGYGDESGYEKTSADSKESAHAHDAWLVGRGAVVGMAGTPIQVRNHANTGVRIDEGSYLVSDPPSAGCALIEAAPADEAAELVSRTPCAVAYGVVEVWPLLTPSDG